MRGRAAHDRATADQRAAGTPAPARFGFTTTKKLGNAVTRNRIRRRLKEVVRLIAPAHARDGHDYVLVARVAAETRPFDALASDLIAALAAMHAQPGRGPRPAAASARAEPDKMTSGRTRTRRPPQSEG